MKAKKITQLVDNFINEATKLQDFEKDVGSSESPEQIISFIKKYMQDVYNVSGDKKEVSFVLDTLISQCNDKKTKVKLEKARKRL